MNVTSTNRTDRAIEAALKEFGGNESSALVCLFLGLSRRLGLVFGGKSAAGLAYTAADELATQDGPTP